MIRSATPPKKKATAYPPASSPAATNSLRNFVTGTSSVGRGSPDAALTVQVVRGSFDPALAGSSVNCPVRVDERRADHYYLFDGRRQAVREERALAVEFPPAKVCPWGCANAYRSGKT